MPIDTRLLLNDESLWSDLETSLSARRRFDNKDGGDNHEDEYAQHMATTLRRLIDEGRIARQELETYRSQRKKKQVVDKDHLQALEQADRQAQRVLTRHLANIPNFTDQEIHSHVDENDGDETIKDTGVKSAQSDRAFVDQIMFSVGGCEQLGNLHVVTRLGRDLLQSVEEYLVQSCSLAEMELLEMPLTLPEGESIIRKRWYPLSDDSDTTTISAPSWLSLVDQHLTRNESYFDRVLPQAYFMSCRGASERRLPQSTTPLHSCWYEDLAVQHQLQVLVVTGPSLAIDSRPLQLEWLERLERAYRQLAPHVDLRIRAIPAPDLMPTEASRLVLEGCVSRQNKQQVVVLATMSNYLDFCSTGLRHGNSIDKRNVHLLHGTVCRAGLAVEWMLQHCQQSETGDSVQLPECIRQGERLVFRRRIVKKKGGKTFVQAIPVARPPVAHPEPTILPALGVHKHNDAELTATPERIRQEAASCPFDFLPFFYR